jgi:hypothetical protein
MHVATIILWVECTEIIHLHNKMSFSPHPPTQFSTSNLDKIPSSSELHTMQLQSLCTFQHVSLLQSKLYDDFHHTYIQTDCKLPITMDNWFLFFVLVMD